MDIVIEEYIFNEERNSFADYIDLMPTANMVSMLSRQYYIPDQNIMNHLTHINIIIWSLLGLSYMSITLLNSLKLKNFEHFFNISLDYFFMLLRRGNYKIITTQ